ncbi:hypothetical protein KUTeg_003124 [Tegillarca granosa]|uniref:Chitin-binding type-2 domain-containing protein n=1 Tax=Tegillarca granosa TaxID=220873 RepID=A0ABQ9FL79_TEGGR|nr:hypothetical protein KUTeg_003124 [Tegillarca granosa]
MCLIKWSWEFHRCLALLYLMNCIDILDQEMALYNSFGLFLIFLPTFIQGQYSCVGRKDDFYPDPSDCEAYYICAVGQVFTVRCASGLHFNAKLKYCDLPKNANCASYPVVPLTQPTQLPVTQQTTPTSTKLIFPITQSTNILFPVVQTQTPQPKPVTQKATTSMFPFWIFTSRPTVVSPSTIHPSFPAINSGSGNTPSSSVATILPGTVKPVIIPSPNNICNGLKSGIYADLSDCGHYYQCVYGLTIRQPCPPQLAYSSIKQSCDYPINVPRCINYQYTG